MGIHFIKTLKLNVVALCGTILKNIVYLDSLEKEQKYWSNKNTAEIFSDKNQYTQQYYVPNLVNDSDT